jgi:hypothetical protein
MAKFVVTIPLLRQARKRYAHYYKDSKDKLSINLQLLCKCHYVRQIEVE